MIKHHVPAHGELNSECKPFTGVILAGGRGRRFDGRDKGLVEVSGRPLVEYALEILAPQTSEIIINANRNLQEYRRYGYRVIPDTLPGYPGPLAGMLAGLQYAQNEQVIFIPCDMPALPANLVTRMHHVLTESSAEVCIPHDGVRNHPVIALMGVSRRDVLQAYLSAGKRKVENWMAAQQLAVADFSDIPRSFRNLNTPDYL